MIYKKFLFIFFILVIVAGGVAQVPKYSFGSMQQRENFIANPGQEINEKLYIYNVYGDKDTHVKFEFSKPKNWEVIIKPKIESVKYDVSGEIIEFEENIVISPSEFLDEPGEDTEGINYIKSKEGYIGANYVTIDIKIPEDEKIGISKNVIVKATAFWLAQGGSIDLKQERDFVYNIKVLSGEVYERKITDEEINKEEDIVLEDGDGASPITGAVVGVGEGKINIFSITLIVVIILLVAIIFKSWKDKKKYN